MVFIFMYVVIVSMCVVLIVYQLKYGKIQSVLLEFVIAIVLD